MVARGDLIELDVDALAFQGVAVARHEGLVFFLPYAVPGDRVIARVRRKKKKHAEATIETLVAASPARIKPRCRYFGVCGGCTCQNIQYTHEIELKRRQVVDLFERIAALKSPPVEQTIASKTSFFYRNKMEFTFGPNRWLTQEEIDSGRELDKGFALGLHIPKRFDKILDLKECFLQSELSRTTVNFTRDLARSKNWTPYHSRLHSGYLRNLVIRTASATGQILVNLVTSRREPDRERLFAQALRERFSEVTTLVTSVNSTRSPVARGKETIQFGPGYILEHCGGLKFKIDATSFFQPNTGQAEELYKLIGDLACLTGRETVFDLYSGIGGIGLYLAPNVARVVGIENEERAVTAAEENAALNEIENCHFETANVAEVLGPALCYKYGAPDLVVLDPPRAGLHKTVCDRLLVLEPPTIIYSSCNPATQARDVRILMSKYRVEAIHPVDMFPQTYHIENVVLLRKKA